MSNQKTALAKAPSTRTPASAAGLRLVRGHAGRAPAFADLIKRELGRVQKEMDGFAIALGIRPGKGARSITMAVFPEGEKKSAAARAAFLEHYFWDGQAQSAGMSVDDDEYWRKFPLPTGARIRCLDMFTELALLLRPYGPSNAGYTTVEWAAAIDSALEVLRSEVRKAGPAPSPGIYRPWLRKQEIKAEIRNLEDKLKSCEA